MSIKSFFSIIFVETTADIVARIKANLNNPEELNKILFALNMCSEITIRAVLRETFFKLKNTDIAIFDNFKKTNRVAQVLEQDHLRTQLVFMQYDSDATRADKVKNVKDHIEKYNTNIDGKDIDGYTLLHRAVDFYDVGLVGYLVEERGADVTIKSPFGKTALDCADKEDIKEYLERKTKEQKLYGAIEKQDVAAFKKRLEKKREVPVVRDDGVSVVQLIREKIEANEKRVGRFLGYFINFNLDRMLSFVSRYIEKLLLNTKIGEPFSPELLSQLDQSSSDGIYYALQGSKRYGNRLVEKLKLINLAPYKNIEFQVKRIRTEEAPVTEDAPVQAPVISRVGTAIKIRINLPASGGQQQPVAKDKEEKEVAVVHETVVSDDLRSRFHEYLRDENIDELNPLLENKQLSRDLVEEALNHFNELDSGIESCLRMYLDAMPSVGYRQ